MGVVLVSKIGNSELLELYGYEPYGGSDVATRWGELSTHWTPANSQELGDMRQMMLMVHRELFPEDSRWIK